MLSAEEGTKVGQLVTVQVQGNILSFPSENVATNQEGGPGEGAREINDRITCLDDKQGIALAPRLRSLQHSPRLNSN
jgi:hypothetical protein